MKIITLASIYNRKNASHPTAGQSRKKLVKALTRLYSAGVSWISQKFNRRKAKWQE